MGTTAAVLRAAVWKAGHAPVLVRLSAAACRVLTCVFPVRLRVYSGEVQQRLAAAKQGKPQAPLDFVRRARREGTQLPRWVVGGVTAWAGRHQGCCLPLSLPLTHNVCNTLGLACLGVAVALLPYGTHLLLLTPVSPLCSCGWPVVCCRYQITDKVPRAGHPDWKRVVAVIVMVREALDEAGA